jgi:hypothetical protein
MAPEYMPTCLLAPYFAKKLWGEAKWIDNAMSGPHVPAYLPMDIKKRALQGLVIEG